MTAIPGYTDETLNRAAHELVVCGQSPDTRYNLAVACRAGLAAIRQCQANAKPDPWAEDDSIGKAFKILLDWAMEQWRQIQPLAERVQAMMDEEAAKKVLIEDEP